MSEKVIDGKLEINFWIYGQSPTNIIVILWHKMCQMCKEVLQYKSIQSIKAKEMTW